jgi:hypothetical protein
MPRRRCRRAWTPAPRIDVLSAYKWLAAGALIVGVGVAACSTTSDRQPSPSPATASPVPGPTSTPMIAQRPPTPTTTVYPPVERHITLNTAIEGVYVPGQVRELYILHNDRPRRISVNFAPLDESGPLNLRAQVYTPDGALVPQVSGQPLERGEWDLLVQNHYIIQVFGPETQARAFTLTVTSRSIPADVDYTIAYGQSRSGAIAARGQRDRWSFEAHAGDHVQIIMTAPGDDGELVLYGPDGEFITRDDDHPRLGPNPVLDLVLPVDGSYTIVARMYGDESTGAYNLTLEKLSED